MGFLRHVSITYTVHKNFRRVPSPTGSSHRPLFQTISPSLRSDRSLGIRSVRGKTRSQRRRHFTFIRRDFPCHTSRLLYSMSFRYPGSTILSHVVEVGGGSRVSVEGSQPSRRQKGKRPQWFVGRVVMWESTGPSMSGYRLPWERM